MVRDGLLWIVRGGGFWKGPLIVWHAINCSSWMYRSLRIFRVTKFSSVNFSCWKIFVQMDIRYEKLPKYYNSERDLQLATDRDHLLLLSLCSLSFLPNKLSLWREQLTCWRRDLASLKSNGLLLSCHGDMHISLYRLGRLGYTYKRKERVLVVCLPASISKLYWQILSEWYLLLVLAMFLVAVFGSLCDLAIG